MNESTHSNRQTKGVHLNILFMCVANSARSQIAEGLARAMLPPGTQIQSAGSKPGTLNPWAVTVMKEIDIDITKHRSKAFADLPNEFRNHLDYIITLCADEVCPIVPSGAQKLHWPLPDPATKESVSDDESLRRFRDTREALKAKLAQFKLELQQ